MVTHKLPVLETKEARRLPEVTDDDFMSVINTTDTPQVDAWKATIKDHKVNYIENESLNSVLEIEIEI